MAFGMIALNAHGWYSMGRMLKDDREQTRMNHFLIFLADAFVSLYMFHAWIRLLKEM